MIEFAARARGNAQAPRASHWAPSLLGAMLGLLLVVLLCGCGTGNKVFTGDPDFTPDQMPAPPQRDIVIAGGDVLEFRFFYSPELNDVQTVRPDGKIAMQLVGEVVASGKTPGQLAAELKSCYGKYLRSPEVAVVTRQLLGQRVYVGGQVNSPGPVEMPGRLTALEAILSAGGFTMESAQPKNVIVIRHLNGKRYGTSLDLGKALEGKATEPFYLEPHDIIWVPKTLIANANQWIDQHINKMIPELGLSYSFPHGSGTLTLDATQVGR